jgi:hypothetical protein
MEKVFSTGLWNGNRTESQRNREDFELGDMKCEKIGGCEIRIWRRRGVLRTLRCLTVYAAPPSYTER